MNEILPVVPRIAVLLAAYNGVLFIEEQLDSILKQKYVDVTVFISVDISTDGTYEWCCNFAQDKSNIHILSYGDKFGGAGPNFYRLIRDVDVSGFEYVAFSDQDDIWLDDKLVTACKYMSSHRSDAYSSDVLAFWSDGREQIIIKSQPQRKYDYLFEAAGPGCSYVMKVAPIIDFKQLLFSHWEQVNRVSLHDWLMYAFFRANGYQWFIAPEYKMRYRQHVDNQVGINKGLQAAINRLRLLKNGWYKKQVLAISGLIGHDLPEFSLRWMVLKNIAQLRRRRKDRFYLFIIALIGFY